MSQFQGYKFYNGRIYSFPLNNSNFIKSNTSKTINKDNYILIKKKKIKVKEQKNKSPDFNPKTQFIGSETNKTYNNLINIYNNEYTDEYNNEHNNKYNKLPNPNVSKDLINEKKNDNKNFGAIDLKNYDLKSLKEHINKKLYIIIENYFNKFNSKRTTQIGYNTLNFITSSEKVKELIHNNINFILVDKRFLILSSTQNFNCEGNHVFLYEIEQRAFIFFPKEGNIIEIPKKNEISSNEKNNEENKNSSIINSINNNNENLLEEDSSFQPRIIEDHNSINEEDEEKTAIKALILLYGFQKYFIKLMKSPIIDEFDFNEYYLINKDWIEDFKASFKFKEICGILDKKNYNYSYKGFSKNIEKIINLFPFKTKNRIILNSTHEFYPKLKEIKRNQDLTYPTDFELIPEDLFNLLLKKAKKETHRKDDDFRYKVLMGDNVLFVQNQKKNNIFYTYILNKDSNLKIIGSLIYFEEEKFYKDISKYIKEQGFINFLMEREIEMANYNNKSLIVKDKEEESRCKFVNLSKMSEYDFEELKIKNCLKSNKKLLSKYNDFIKNCLLLKDNKKEITSFNDILLYYQKKDLSLLPVIIILKKSLDKLKKLLYFPEIEYLTQLKAEIYDQEEEKIINNLINSNNKIKVKDFVENNMIFFNSTDTDIDQSIGKNLSLSILNKDFLLMINNSPYFYDTINKINGYYLFKNNNQFFILHLEKYKLYKVDFIEEFEFTLKEEDFNLEFKNILKIIKKMIEFEELIQNLIKSNLNNISNPEEFYLINSKWMEKYKSFYNYNAIISNKNKDDKDLFNYIRNKQSFPDDLKNENNLYPDIDRNFPNLKVPINFEIINKTLFCSIIQDIKEKTNADLKTNYIFKVLLGDNKLFIQDNSIKKLYYIYNEANELKYIIQFYNKDLTDWIQSKNYTNFEDLLLDFGVDLSKNEYQMILDDKLEKFGEIYIIKTSNSSRSIKEPNHCLGLENIGATCYMNATIQCLCHVLNMKKYFQNRQLVFRDTNNKNCPLTIEFYKLVNNLWKDKYKKKNYFTPTDFKSLISQMNPLFKGIAANDSKDLIIFIYENMHNEINKEGQYNNYNNNYQNNALQLFRRNYYSLNSSFLIETFYFEQQSELKCLSCKFNKISYNISNILIFPLEKVREYMVQKSPNGFECVSLENCFENYQEVEILSGQNQIFCNACKRMSNASTGNKMFTSPEVMTIILNRGKGLEFQVEFKYPLFLNIDKYVVDKSQNNNNYELICVLTHLGPSGMSGHFIVFCKSPNDDRWYCYNDAKVTEIDDPTEVDEGEFESVPYVLFYQKCSQNKILNNNNSINRRNQKNNSYKYNNIESSGINRINSNNTITLYFSYKNKEFYLDVNKDEKFSELIKKLNKKYKMPKKVTFYKVVGDNLSEIKFSKTVKDNNLKNQNKIIVLDEDVNAYGNDNDNDNDNDDDYYQYYYNNIY